MKMRGTILIFLLFLSVTSLSPAQREASRWYFGNQAGLDFNTGAPVALTDGNLIAHEGCSTISGQNGNLLFYSNGIKVWDKAHRLMPNGTGLLGHESSTQSAIIVPKAGSGAKYYIFTVNEPDSEKTDNKGFNCTLVDLSLNNSYGDVVSFEKNVHLVTYGLNKVLVTIYGNDGNRSWFFAEKQPQVFSVGIPMASSYSTIGTNRQPRKTDTPIYVIHGENDECSR